MSSRATKNGGPIPTVTIGGGKPLRDPTRVTVHLPTLVSDMGYSGPEATKMIGLYARLGIYESIGACEGECTYDRYYLAALMLITFMVVGAVAAIMAGGFVYWLEGEGSEMEAKINAYCTGYTGMANRVVFPKYCVGIEQQKTDFAQWVSGLVVEKFLTLGTAISTIGVSGVVTAMNPVIWKIANQIRRANTGGPPCCFSSHMSDSLSKKAESMPQ